MLINSVGTVLSPQRFTDEIFTKIDTLNSAACQDDFANYVKETALNVVVEKHEVLLVEYANKYGRKILGSHVVVDGPVKGLKWCVLVEMGEKEALSNFDNILLEATVLSLIVIIVFTSVFIFIFDFFFGKLFKS
jgi:hypothetical protein